MRTTICRSSWSLLVAGALVAPALLSAQGTDSAATGRARTHVVRPGDTLWRLAQEYLGNGHRWRELLELNADVIRGPTHVPVGTTLRIQEDAAPQTAESVFGPVPPGPEAPVPTAPRTPVAQTLGQERARTIFYKPPTESDTVPRVIQEPASAVRAFEAAAAPFVVDSARLTMAGRCLEVKAAGADSVAGVAGVSLLERMTLTLPAGAPADTQARFVLVRPGPYLGLGQVVVPTGIVRVRAPGPPVEADIVAQFDVVSCADVVLPLEIPVVPEGARPAAVATGPWGRVVWVPSEALLPTLQHYIMVDLGSQLGVRPGDQVTVYDALHADAVSAVATVVRVSANSATAVIIDQSREDIVEGAPVRVTAKLP